MAGYKKQHTDGPNSEDKALDLFAEMMIEKIESIRKVGESHGSQKKRYNGPAIFPDASIMA